MLHVVRWPDRLGSDGRVKRESGAAKRVRESQTAGALAGARRDSSAKEARGAGQMAIDRASPRSEKPPSTVPRLVSVKAFGDRV